jgi:SpoIID/LytB domain protein
MSQFGAYGQALEGSSATEILTHYYPGTSVEPVDDSRLIRVNIANKVAAVNFRSNALVGTGAPMLVYAGDLPAEQPTSDQPVAQLNPGQQLNFSALSGTLITTVIDALPFQATTLPSNAVWTIRWSGTVAYPGETNIVTMRQGGLVRKYKYGQIQIKFVPPVAPAIQGAIEVTNTLRIHTEYLRGIGEVPSSWPAAALQAQVIAARSFALSKAGTYRKGCDCNLLSSVQDQNFVGYSKESEPRFGQMWIDAVAATEFDAVSGLAVVYEGEVVTTFYASSTGGMAEDVGEVWGNPLPYLVPVDDRWSLDAVINPTFSSWVRKVSQESMAKAFGLPDVLRYEVTARTQGGGVRVIVAYSSNGKSAELTGERFRSRLKLPSNWIALTVNRVSVEDPEPLAVAVNRYLWPNARSAVLVNFEQDPAGAIVGMAYGNLNQLPVLHVTSKGIGKESAKELTRRKITSVVLIGRSSALPNKALVARAKLRESRLDGRDEIELSERVLVELVSEPVILLTSERNRMLDDAARILAANRAIVWSKEVEIPTTLDEILLSRGSERIFYEDLDDFSYPTRVVVTGSSATAFISSIWRSPIVRVDGSEVARSAELLEVYPNIAAITLVDKELASKPFEELS